jgi:hypothetical protein
MSIYRTLVNNPPKIVVAAGMREVIFTLISCMCDNKYTLSFKKDSKGGDFRASLKGGTMLHCFSNIQANYEQDEMEWAADAEDWKVVVDMINTGTAQVQSVRQR